MGYYKCTQLPIEVKTASGAVASFSDGLDSVPVVSAVCQVVAEQSGTGEPSPSNPRPITSKSSVTLTKTGKNIFDYTTVTEGKYLNSSGVISTSAGYYVSDYIPVKSGATYTFSGYTPSGTAAYNCFYDSSKNFVSSQLATTNPIIIPAGIAYVRLSIRGTDISIDDVQFEVGSSPSSFKSYSAPTAYTVALDPASYGCEVDMAKSENGRKETIGEKALNDLSFNRTTSYANPIFYAAITDKKVAEIEMLSENFVYIGSFSNASQFATAATNDNVIGNCKGNQQIFIRADSYSDAAALLQALGTSKIIYELSTPIYSDITAQNIKTLQGDDNFYNDSANTEIKYRAKA